MPYKFETEKKKIPFKLDRRRKIDENMKLFIKRHYHKMSQRKIAKFLGISRTSVKIVYDEEYKNKVKLTRIINGIKNNNYYRREKHKQYMKKYRTYKKTIQEELQ